LKKQRLIFSSLLVLSLGLAACSNDGDSKTKDDGSSHHVSEQTDSSNTKKETATKGHDDAKKGDDDHHHQEVDFKFEQNTAEKGKETTVSATLTMKKKPLTDANVRYQITYENEEKAAWVNLKEDKPGHYTAQYTFEKAGKYNGKLHVVKGDDLHNHEDNVFTVK